MTARTSASDPRTIPRSPTDATVTVEQRVGVVPAEGRAVGAQLLVRAGVTGLLGPNGAGKTTLMRAMTGLIDVNQGTVRIDGSDPRRDREVFRRLALVPEDEAVPSGLTARQFVRYVADLHGVADRTRPRTRCDRSRCSTSPTAGSTTFSKGMRQRTKVAAALVCDPHVLVLDEPLNGADPVQRVHLIALFKQLGAQGRTVIVSSHVLNEVERLAERVIVLIHGRLAAAGGHHAIRDAMDDRPAARARALRRRTALGVRADRARLGRRRDASTRSATGS